MYPTTPRPVELSLVEMTEIVLPEDANSHGSIFGGRVLALVDKCAAIVAMRHTRSLVLTASVDSVAFLNPVRVGHVLVLKGRLNAVFGSSMEIEVQVFAEDPLSGQRNMTTRAFVTMVAVGDTGAPHAAPPLAPATDAERERAALAEQRRLARLALRHAAEDL
jgi:acyl-CoA hydrolase